MIYLDNAATTFPKPQTVTEETERCIRLYGGNPGRGTHRLALAAAEKVYECREAAAAFFGAAAPERVVFTMNTTYALNTAIKAVLRPGDHVLIGTMAHNAVFRPVSKLAQEGKIQYDFFDIRADGERVTAELSERLRRNTRAVICTHMSNVVNVTAPVEVIGTFCREHGLCLILDAAQSAGVCPIRVEEMHIGILCAPGHKGLYGPQGCGMMVFGEERWAAGTTLIEGGSGIHSLERDMPDGLPERFEAGTLPVPAIAGLLEGIRWVERTGVERICERERMLQQMLADDLHQMPGIHVIGNEPGAILSFCVAGMSCSAVSAELDSHQICTRAGYHCAPLAHRELGTEADGTVRISFGAMNTERDVKRCADILNRIAKRTK